VTDVASGHKYTLATKPGHSLISFRRLMAAVSSWLGCWRVAFSPTFQSSIAVIRREGASLGNSSVMNPRRNHSTFSKNRHGRFR